MKKTFQKIIGVALIAAMCLGLLAGCGGGGGNSASELPELGDRYTLDANTPAYKLDTQESSKLTWYVNADWWNTDWGTDTVTKKIQEDLGLEVEFITGDDTKLNTLFAGETLPDIITIFDSGSSVANSAADWAWSLNDLADKYDPYFYQVAKPDTLNWFRLSDGKTYGYPGYSNSAADYASGQLYATTAFVIRKDVYEALGKPSMKTPEEFLDTLNKIKEQFPDLIPFGSNSMTSSEGSLGADFMNYLGVPIENEDGTWYDRVMDEDYQAWLKVLNQAYRNGCISDDNFSDDGTAHEEKVASGRYATIFIGGTPQRSGFLQTWYSTNPDAQYIAIDGPASTLGRTPTLSQAGLSGWTISYITKQCKDPITAIKTFTYLLTDEAGMLCTYGVEGETYKINDEGLYELLPEVAAMRDNESEKYKKVYRLGEFLIFGHDRYASFRADPTPSMVQINEWGKDKLKPQFILENITPDQGTAEARALSAINTNWYTTLVAMIRSKDDASFDQTLEDFKAFRASNSWDDIVEIYNEKVAANREKLNG